MIIHLRAAGVSLVIDARGTRVPVLVHWGADLGELSEISLASVADATVPAIGPSSLDVPLRLSLLPTLREGWSGRPAISGHRAGSPTIEFDLSLDRVTGSGLCREFVLVDAAAAVTVTVELELTPHGVLRLRHTLTNRGATAFELGSLDVVLPVPDRAREILDFTGLWTHERRPQRTALAHGTWSRESRHGRPGHDDAFLTVIGAAGYGFRAGEVWATHLAWSGDKRTWAESSPLGRVVLGLGELLAPGEVSVVPGGSYSTPWSIAVHSVDGLDGLSARLHPWIRSWSTITSPRPVVLNSWEAVYFDQGMEQIAPLVDAAAHVGVERFVLDDGWFTGRSDDRRALGDWFVDAVTWPEGLHPLIDRVHAAGMDFGLWVEPEMVNPDSDLARRHPEWILGGPSAHTWRNQQALDLGNPEVFDYLLGRLNALLEEYPVAYLKWDHNRDLLSGSAHRQTTALYRLIDAVRTAHPTLEIESCASGGARIDLGILERVDRVWTSDTNDPLERQEIQRYTGLLIPPEYLGSHLGAARSHTTMRSSDLAFRFATALFGNAGIEWDLTVASGAEHAQIAEWIGLYKQLRELLHGGTVVRADSSDPAVQLHGVVSADQQRAVFAQVSMAAPGSAIPPALRFVGLAPDTVYRVTAVTAGANAQLIQTRPPAWLESGGVSLPGRVLETVGLARPMLAPEQAALYSVIAE
ncbi:alpha-galactosidase [Glaciihabitans tibetensis]|uniref:alpha-galactosidase n=1 Tax=Glaciihabitans tibetensis TaxID=1266600 RepID=A0A2T0V4I8_9MICO|nr:alpha-galactosidase [Glaciihabitans tibetensis]PRY65037.1 alpha-galactosidase [Glaciihabitans tibetensis]